jgi:hypothetical protein
LLTYTRIITKHSQKNKRDITNRVSNGKPGPAKIENTFDPTEKHRNKTAVNIRPYIMVTRGFFVAGCVIWGVRLVVPIILKIIDNWGGGIGLRSGQTHLNWVNIT